MIGEEPEWITYDTWGAHLPEVPGGYRTPHMAHSHAVHLARSALLSPCAMRGTGGYELSIGAENFREILRRYGGPSAPTALTCVCTCVHPWREAPLGSRGL